MVHLGAVVVTMATCARLGYSADLPKIGVYLSFDAVPEAESVLVMKAAVGELLKPAGIALVWRSTSANAGTESFAGLAVLHFKGRCKATSPLPLITPEHTPEAITTLALTDATRGEILPFTKVQCDEVRKAMMYVPRSAGPTERRVALGLALARVVAHELYHILANTAGHTAEGLAKASQFLPDLVSTRELTFDALSLNEIRTGSERLH